MSERNCAVKPLLAAKIEFDPQRPEVLDAQLAAIRYPVIGSPKVDGIRVLCHPELGPVTRKLKPVPNRFVRGILSDPALHGLDGEVTVGPPNIGDVFARTTGAIRSFEGEPDFQYHIFDDFTKPDALYYGRQASSCMYDGWGGGRIKSLGSKWLQDRDELLNYEAECLENGFEGACFRDPNGRYKFNRSTFREGILLKLKRISDSEAVVRSLEPRRRNDNEQTRDALGYATRSSHQDNKTELPMVGKLVCDSCPAFPGVMDIKIGSGFDHSLATQWWENPDSIIGQTVTFVYQECGTVDKPRHPIYKGIRID
jgi:DNA ligase-1